ncbi:MAG: hypothetical protein KAG97_01470, partial [Victivallales bacterium]|nr:hypothetical protein [Victivallales bacterium]
IACPRSLNPVLVGDPTKVDWIDAQAFGGYNGWLKDNGDISLRKITSRMTRDGDILFLKLSEKELDRKIGEGDSWEIFLRNEAKGAVYKMRIDKDANIAGRVATTSGAPEDWSGHYAKAVSSLKENRWDLVVAMPVNKEYLDKYNRMFINIRRNDAKLADSPVLVATGNKFELAKTGALVTFDKLFVKDAPPPAAEDLILDWRFTGKGSVIKDVSGHGNDGTLHGMVKRCKGGVEFNGGRYKGPGQYLKIPKVKGLDAGNMTFSCWLNYKKANTRGGRRIFTWGAYHSTIAVPYRKLMLLAAKKDGKITGAGPFGPELPPKKWFMYTMTFDGNRMNIYENGRGRGGVGVKSHKLLPPDVNSAWLFGGLPKLAPWYTFIGEMKVIQIYGRSLSPQEIMAKYKAEYIKYRKGGK